MTRKRIVYPTLGLMAATACAVGVLPTASARAATVQQTESGNWSGYVVGKSDNGSFKSVTGSWVQPKANCEAANGSTYAAFWVGIGGADGKTALEQDGTEVNCSADGTASYYAWYELVPKAPVKVDLPVRPGDKITATTTVDGHNVTETITNDTTGDTFTKTLYMANPDTSTAEWVAEAPSQCSGGVSNCTTLPLSDFGKVNFTSSSATDSSGHTGSISDSSWQAAAITLNPSEGSSGAQYISDTSASGAATPSGLSDDGSAFSVSYQNAGATSTSTGTGGYGSSGYGSTGGYGSSGYGYGAGDGYGYGSGDGYGYGSTGGYGYGSGDGYGYGSTGGYGYGGGAPYILIYTY
jgi:hypothetical protein